MIDYPLDLVFSFYGNAFSRLWRLWGCSAMAPVGGRRTLSGFCLGDTMALRGGRRTRLPLYLKKAMALFGGRRTRSRLVFDNALDLWLQRFEWRATKVLFRCRRTHSAFDRAIGLYCRD